MKIYIAGALTHGAEKKLKELYLEIGKFCKQNGFENAYVPCYMGTDPIKNPDVAAEKVWEIDEREVSSSDLIIAYVGEPSLGVGGELEIARAAGRDIILWWFTDQKVSRMALGNPAVIARLEIKDKQELFKQLKVILKEKYRNQS